MTAASEAKCGRHGGGQSIRSGLRCLGKPRENLVVEEEERFTGVTGFA